MPIRPENKARYPKDWKQIRDRIVARAHNRCEGCGVVNHAWGWRDSAGEFHSVRKGPLREAGCVRPPFNIASWSDYPSQCEPGRVLKIVEIILTVAHLDHQPENCADDNLKAWCQRCHNRYDTQNRLKGRRLRAQAGPSLFETGSVQ